VCARGGEQAFVPTSTMRAATYERNGPARDVLTLRELPIPEPGPGEVRVRIATSGVNPSDTRRRGADPVGGPAEFPLVVPHSDGAGTIDAVGSGVDARRMGERVWTFNAQFGRPFGTAAEYCVVPDELAVHLPESIDFASGACIGIPALTAYHAVMLDGTVAGQTILVQGGAGAVGHYAVQFAKLGGATVIATVSSDAKAEHARAAGADHTVNYRTEDLPQRLRELTGGRGIKRIIEVDFSANAKTYHAILADSAKVIVYGSGGSVTMPSFVRLQTGFQFFNAYRIDVAVRRRNVAAVSALLARGVLQHAVGRRFALERIVDAHEAVEQGTVLGNVVVEVAARP
jgi:NADPH2:quinone reductase